MKRNCHRVLICFLFLVPSTLLAVEPQVQRFGVNPERGYAEAVRVENAALLHTRQLLPVNSENEVVGPSIETQCDAVLNSLDLILKSVETDRSQIVKLNFYLNHETDRKQVSRRILSWCGEKSLPAVSFVQTRLPRVDCKIALDAVVAIENAEADEITIVTKGHLNPLGGGVRITDYSILPRGDVVYVSGQAEPGELSAATLATLKSLVNTLEHLQLNRNHIVALKCFLTPMGRANDVQQTIEQFFEGNAIPVVSYVEWLAGDTRPIEIELIAAAPHSIANESVTYFTPPELKASPVFSRVARIHGERRIYISGLYSDEAGDGEKQTRMIFEQLTKILSNSGSDMRHLAKATYYVSTSEASSQLNQIRPSIYDPERPPAASKALVIGAGMSGRQLSIDMIAAPTIHEEE